MEPTIQDVLQAIGQFSTNIDRELLGIKGDILGIKKVMATKGDISKIYTEIEGIHETMHAMTTHMDEAFVTKKEMFQMKNDLMNNIDANGVRLNNFYTELTSVWHRFNRYGMGEK